MKNRTWMSFVVGVAVLAASTAGPALAKTSPRAFEGVWRLDSSPGYGRQYRDEDWRRDGSYDRGGSYRNRDDRSWNGGSWNGNEGRWGNDSQALPNVFRIENARGVLRIERMNGALIEAVATSRRLGTRGAENARWYGNGFEFESADYGRARVIQRFSLESRGRRLVVHTTIEGSRGGNRDFTQIYEKA